MTTSAALAAAATTIISHLRGFLLLHKEADANHNLLAILGMFPSDFPTAPSLLWDNDGITVQTRMFNATCTCSSHSLDPKINKVEIDGGWHASTCHLAMVQKLLVHSCLIAVEDDGEDMTWTFQWPRDLEPNRYVIGTRFPDAAEDTLWPAFKKSWSNITDMMPEMEFSLAEKAGAIPVAEEEWKPLVDDFDLDFTSPIAEPEPDPEPEISVVHGAGNPEVEAAAQKYIDAQPKRKPGRPKGTSAKAQEAAKELASADFAPVVVEGKKVFPSCQKFGQFASDELSRLCTVVMQIVTAEDHFPVDTIESLKNSLDRLALRAAHLQMRGRHEEDNPNALNPLVEITVANVEANIASAVRDLGLAPEKASSWETFVKSVKESLDVAKCLGEVMSQTGAGPTIQEPSTAKNGAGTPQ